MKHKKKMIIAIILVVLLAVLIFAIITSSSSNSVKITFETHGGTEIKSQEVKKGEKIKEPEEPTKEGYEFVGWYYDGKKFDFDQEINKAIELEAKWIKISAIKYTVSFDSQNGSSVADQKIEKGKKATKPSNPTRSGYTFVEWTLDGKTYDFDSAVEKNITLVAVWKSNGGNTNTPVSGTINKPSVDQVVINKNPGKTDSTVTTKPETPTNPEEKPETPVEPEQPTETYYTVTFYDGSHEIMSQSVKEGETVDFFDYRILDHKLSGWKNGEQVFDFTNPVTSDLNLYAIWRSVLDVHNVDNIALNDFVGDQNYDKIEKNQEAIDVITTDFDTIVVVKKAELDPYGKTFDGTVENKKWYGILVDLGIDLNDLIIENIDPKYLEDAKNKFGQTADTTAFVIWLDADSNDSNITFKRADDESITGTISIEMKEEIKAEEVVNLTFNGQNVTYDSDMKANNENITVGSNIATNTVTVTEDQELIAYDRNGATGKWYGLIFDLGIDPSELTIVKNDCLVDENDITEETADFGVASSTAFIIWFQSEGVDTTDTITFYNDGVPNDQVDITITFDAIDAPAIISNIATNNAPVTASVSAPVAIKQEIVTEIVEEKTNEIEKQETEEKMPTITTEKELTENDSVKIEAAQVAE